MNDVSQNTSNIQTEPVSDQPNTEVTEAQKTAIRSLAPKILTSEKDLARVKPYLDLLTETIDAPGITNIALTGNYGSGKSTIINTFQHQHSEYEYLRISLASFGNVSDEIEETKAEPNSAQVDGNQELQPKATGKKPVRAKPDKKAAKEKKEELERLLEISILQQIFYHVKPSAIPDSRFKRITNIKDEHIFMIAASFVLWVASALMLFKFDYIDRINPVSWNTKLNFDWWAPPIFLIFFTGIGIFAKNIVRLLSNSKINKVNIKGELELGDKLDKSVFNEHLEEILYFFERTKFNLVVIEDLDRFDSTDIFTKLRELNTLLNNSQSIKERKGHKDIVFLYAISDETFSDKNERVKFFEYIIPVIPFINPSNAGEQLGQLILDAKIEDPRFKEFTEDLVTFIDDIDMRLLTNIFHEYQLYRTNLSLDLEQDKLFSMVTYKNMYPEDFSRLHSRKGVLYDFITNRAVYLKDLKDSLDQRIEENQEDIDIISALRANQTEDLKALYIKAIYQKFPGALGIRLSNAIDFSELIKDENFNQFAKMGNFEYWIITMNPSYGLYRQDFNRSNISFSGLEQEINPGFTYAQTVQQIKDLQDGREQQLKEENESLNQKKQDMELWSLSEIFEEVDIDPHISHFADNGLIRNLLLNGYIDENYADYISLFHEVNMTADDFAFEKKIKSGTVLPFEYKLTSIAYLVKKLAEKYFKREVILNLDLVECLMEDQDSHIEKRSKLLGLLSSERDRPVRFIDQFITKKPQQVDVFIKLLASFWPGFWSYLETKSGYTSEKLDSYLKLLVTHSDISDLKSQGKSLASHIEKKADFLLLFSTPEEIAKAKTAIDKLEIRFETISAPDETTGELFDHVYDNGHYRINVHNVQLIIAQKGSDTDQQTADTANYTTIQNSACEPLKKYVQSNLNSYVENVLLKISGNTKEAEVHLLKLLNDEGIKRELRTAIISGKCLQISDLSGLFHPSLQELALQEEIVEPVWNNVFAYYDTVIQLRGEGSEGSSFDDTLIAYLNIEHNYLALSQQQIAGNEAYETDSAEKLSIEIMMCNELSEKAYAALMLSHSFYYDTEDMSDLNADKVAWAVHNSRIELSKYTYDHLKEYFPGQQTLLIESQQDELSNKIGELQLDEADSATLLDSDNLEKDSKLLVYDEMPDETVIASPQLSRSSCRLLASAPETEVSYAVAEGMFKHSRSFAERITLLNQRFDKFSAAEIQALLNSLGGDYPDLFKSRHRPKFSTDAFHTELFAKLKSKRMIKDFEPYQKQEGLYRVIANY